MIPVDPPYCDPTWLPASQVDCYKAGWEAARHAAADSELRQEVERLTALLNTPEVLDFAKAVVLEAAHQRERWPEGHDAAKTDADWFWTIGYLAGKALNSPLLKDFEGDEQQMAEKKLHRIITIAAAAANWHRLSVAALSRENIERNAITPPAGDHH